jgi:Fic/DOC family
MAAKPAGIHERLARELSELRATRGGLPMPTEAGGIWDDIRRSDPHGSAASERDPLWPSRIEALLRDGRAVGSQELRQYREAQGYAAAAGWVCDQAGAPSDGSRDPLLTVGEVRHIHTLTMTPVWDVVPHPYVYDTGRPGAWRRHNLPPFPDGTTTPDFAEVPARMRAWVDEVCRNRADDAPIAEVVAALHHAFVRIHPFIDGNGRAGRLLVNLILIRLGYPPAIIHRRQRRDYLLAMQEANDGNPARLGELLARAILEGLMRSIRPPSPGPARWVPVDTAR